MNKYQVIDAMEGMRGLESNYVDLIVTDPPYDTLEKWRNMGTTTRLTESTKSSNRWFPVVPPSYFKDFFKECYRVLKKPSDIFVFCDDDTRYNIDPLARLAGFNRKKALIWEKVGQEEELSCPRCGMFVEKRLRPGSPGMGYPFRSCHEYIYFAQKGKRRSPADKNVRDVLRATNPKKKVQWPTEKPVNLLKVLIKQSSDPGDLVLDPFAGSGSTLVAAWELDRCFLGFDVQQDAKDYFGNRVLHKPMPASDQPDREKEPEIFDLFAD